MDPASSTPLIAPPAPPSTSQPAALQPPGVQSRRHPAIEVGDIVLLKLDEHVRRPLLVTWIGPVDTAAPDSHTSHFETRVSGTLFCQPDDHSTVALRTLGQISQDPARIVGRPDRLLPQCYAECVREGMEVGEWVTKQTRLPGRS